MLIGSSEDVGSVFGKSIKELTDIELLGYLTARKYYLGELDKQKSKEQESKFKEESGIKEANKCTLDMLLKYNNINANN